MLGRRNFYGARIKVMRGRWSTGASQSAKQCDSSQGPMCTQVQLSSWKTSLSSYHLQEPCSLLHPHGNPDPKAKVLLSPESVCPHRRTSQARRVWMPYPVVTQNSISQSHPTCPLWHTTKLSQRFILQFQQKIIYYSVCIQYWATFLLGNKNLLNVSYV